MSDTIWIVLIVAVVIVVVLLVFRNGLKEFRLEVPAVLKATLKRQPVPAPPAARAPNKNLGNVVRDTSQTSFGPNKIEVGPQLAVEATKQFSVKGNTLKVGVIPGPDTPPPRRKGG
jgi:hypothetical protein